MLERDTEALLTQDPPPPALPLPSQQLISRELPKGWENALPTFTPEDKGLATRQHSQTMLNALAPVLPGLIGACLPVVPHQSSPSASLVTQGLCA